MLRSVGEWGEGDLWYCRRCWARYFSGYYRSTHIFGHRLHQTKATCFLGGLSGSFWWHG